jgi:hypothetical protein
VGGRAFLREPVAERRRGWLVDDVDDVEAGTTSLTAWPIALAASLARLRRIWLETADAEYS